MVIFVENTSANASTIDGERPEQFGITVVDILTTISGRYPDQMVFIFEILTRAGDPTNGNGQGGKLFKLPKQEKIFSSCSPSMIVIAVFAALGLLATSTPSRHRPE